MLTRLVSRLSARGDTVGATLIEKGAVTVIRPPWGERSLAEGILGAIFGVEGGPVAARFDIDIVIDDEARTITTPGPGASPWDQSFVTVKWSEVEAIVVEESVTTGRKQGRPAFVVKLVRRTHMPKWSILGRWTSAGDAERFRAWLEKRIKLSGALEW